MYVCVALRIKYRAHLSRGVVSMNFVMLKRDDITIINSITLIRSLHSDCTNIPNTWASKLQGLFSNLWQCETLRHCVRQSNQTHTLIFYVSISLSNLTIENKFEFLVYELRKTNYDTWMNGHSLYLLIVRSNAPHNHLNPLAPVLRGGVDRTSALRMLSRSCINDVTHTSLKRQPAPWYPGYDVEVVGDKVILEVALTPIQCVWSYRHKTKRNSHICTPMQHPWERH